MAEAKTQIAPGAPAAAVQIVYDDSDPRAVATTLARVEADREPAEKDPLDQGELTGFEQRYRVLSELGSGGMGDVMLCKDLWIGRQIAVKVLREEHREKDELLLRFVGEARIQGQLEHPAILPVADLAQREDGSLYFTMKRASGLTLREILDRLAAGDRAAQRRYGRRVLLGALNRVVVAIAYAHSRGVVHRDLKPANVMLGDYDDVYVLDWGIAKLLGEPDAHAPPESVRGPFVRDSLLPSAPDAQAETRADALLGTPGYMAPEQILHEEIDGRADVYALGAMLFEVLADEPLHRGDPLEILDATLIGIDGRPSQRAPDKDVPPELDALCARAVHANRDERISSARELHRALTDYLDGERDQERRSELLERHLARARAARELAAREGGTTHAGIGQRVEALRELNAALALDPKHPAALAALVELLEDIPSRLPRQVELELAQAGAFERLRAARRATLGYVTIALTVAVLLLTSAKNPLFLGLILGCATAAGVHTFVFGPARGRTLHAVMSLLLSALTVGSLSLLFGPLVMAPTVALAMAVTVIVHSRAKPGIRWLVGGAYTLALVGFQLLELVGVLSPSYALEQGSLLVLPRALALGEGGALLLLSVAALLSLLVPTLLVGRSIDALASAERRQAAQLWLLRRLLPETD